MVFLLGTNVEDPLGLLKGHSPVTSKEKYLCSHHKGCVGEMILTPFYVTCQSNELRPIEEWADAEGKGTLGLWVKMGVAADEAKERANGATLASDLLDFVSFV